MSLPKAHAVCVLSLVLLVVGCGSDASPADAEPASRTSAFPVTVDSSQGPVRIQARPERIVSISPTATEMLFAIGAGAQVVAVDDQSNYPAEAPTTKLSGFEPNVEAIARYDPDLVVTASDAGGVAKGLRALDVPVLGQPAAVDLSDSYDQLEELGRATGNPAGATSTISAMRDEIQRIVASVPPPGEPISVYHELDDTYYSATSSTFIGRVYEACGLHNIADEAKGGAGDYPQLSAEFIVDQDPEMIFLADTKCCGQDAETVAARPGWHDIAAVRDDHVVPVDDDIASRWGPRVVTFYRSVAEEISSIEDVQAA